MARLFISHSNTNNAAAIALAKWLSEQGFDDVFLDIDPDRGLAPGERWQEALKAAADRCEAVLFLVSPAWLELKWCLAEFLLAKSLHKRIFGLIVERPAEDALKPGDTFRECTPEQDKDFCPEMVVVPAGSFMMGSPPTEKGRSISEGPQHAVTIARPFAVAKFELTFAEWDTCVHYGECDPHIIDAGWGRGKQPVIYVNWDDAQQYAAWLSKMTGRPYRLLTEAEYEYATRAGTQTTYPWGDDIKLNGTAMANCDGCGSQWDMKRTAPVGSFAANRFGHFDMVGNAWEWLEDCYHPAYEVETAQGKINAPTDGSAWTSRDCERVLRGGSWGARPTNVRSAAHNRFPAGDRISFLSFRVGRTLLEP